MCQPGLGACGASLSLFRAVGKKCTHTGPKAQSHGLPSLQGFLFAFVGACAGLTGTAISNVLLLLRQKLDPKFQTQNEPPNVPLNAATWAAHMGISSNVRYQILNGLDMVNLLLACSG